MLRAYVTVIIYTGTGLGAKGLPTAGLCAELDQDWHFCL